MIDLPNPVSLHAFIHSLNKYLWRIDYILGTGLGLGIQ